jgi:hypothetical protein
MKKSYSLIVVLLSLFLLTGYLYATPEKQLKSTIQTDPIDVSFLQFNVWQEGTSVDNGLEKIKNVILDVDPDIVSFVEVRNYNGEDWTSKIINELAAEGKTYYRGYVNGADCSIISKYPIVSSGPLLANAISLFEINANDTHFIVATAHLDYTYYACYLPRGYNCGGSSPYDGWDQIGSPEPQPVTDIPTISGQNLGSQRDEQIASFINESQGETLPIILLGDFNEPSCLDWTTNQANLFDHNGVIYEWTTTKSLKDDGFVDCFREAYPDEVLNPGFTWPAVATDKGSTSWAPKSDERDRIDYIFYKGNNISVTFSSIVGPKEAYVYNVASDANSDNEAFLAETLPWPSDHKGVYALISIPYTEIDETRNDYLKLSTNEVPVGSAVLVNYKTSQFQVGDVINIYNANEGPGDTPVATKSITVDSASVAFTDALSVGNYIVFLINSNGDPLVDAQSFSIVNDTQNYITSTAFSFEFGTSYSFNYNSINFTSKDWIGIFPADRNVESGQNPGYSSDWVYIPNAKGSYDMLNENYTISETGEYKVYLFSNDSYNIVAGPSYFSLTDKSTRIDQMSEEVSINVYPNPATDIISIKTINNSSIKNLSLYSISGQIVYTQQFYQEVSSSTITTTNLPKGLYVLKILTKNGEVVRKITVK